MQKVNFFIKANNIVMQNISKFQHSIIMFYSSKAWTMHLGVPLMDNAHELPEQRKR